MVNEGVEYRFLARNGKVFLAWTTDPSEGWLSTQRGFDSITVTGDGKVTAVLDMDAVGSLPG